MAKITSGQSREIYKLATAPDKKMSNVQIGKKFGISERAVRFHIAKWESKLHSIAKTNEKAANAIANHAVDVYKEARDILSGIRNSIQEAKQARVSPEKLSPLFNNWTKSLELASNLLDKTVVKREIIEAARQNEFDLSELVLKDPEAAELACKLFERITIRQEKHGKIQSAPDLKDFEKVK